MVQASPHLVLWPLLSEEELDISRNKGLSWAGLRCRACFVVLGRMRGGGGAGQQAGEAPQLLPGGAASLPSPGPSGHSLLQDLP